MVVEETRPRGGVVVACLLFRCAKAILSFPYEYIVDGGASGRNYSFFSSAPHDTELSQMYESYEYRLLPVVEYKKS